MRTPKRTAEEKQESLERLRDVCRTQAGAVHRTQILDCGFTVGEFHGLVARGALEPRFRSTYVLPGTGLSIETRCWSATLSAGGEAQVTSAKALALMGALPERSGPIECLRAGGRPRPQPGVVVRIAPEIAGAPEHRVHGVPTTGFARSTLELAASGRVEDVDRAIDTGARLRLFDGRAFEQLPNELPNHPGLPILSAALGRLDVNTGRKRSELERRLVRLFAENDLPEMVVNGIVHGYEVDLHRPGTRGIIEADGREYHSSPADIARDIEKFRVLEELGFVIQLFDWDAVNYRPAETVDLARRFLMENAVPPVPRSQRVL